MKALTLILLLALCEFAHAELREFKSADGAKTIKAEVISKGPGGKIVIRLEDGQRMTVSPDVFSEADRNYITNWKRLARVDAAPGASAGTDRQSDPPEPEWAQFQARADQVIAHALKLPFVESPITTHPKKENQVFSRHFNVSLSSRAYLLLQETPEQAREAGAMLAKVARYYLEHPNQIQDPDSCYWAGEYHAMALAHFGRYGSIRAGAVPQEDEQILLEYMWRYVNYWSRLELYKISLKHETYIYWNSENHWWQETVCAWAYLSLLVQHPQYANRKLADRKSVEAHLEANTQYLKEHMRQRARKGFLVEISSGGYSTRMHAMYLLIYATAKDAMLRDLARKTMDLWWAFWAEEQIDGERGGGKVRHRELRGLKPDAEGHMFPAWLYFGTGRKDLGGASEIAPSKNAKSAGHGYFYFYSGYFPPRIVHRLVSDRASSGAYSIIQRRLGKTRDYKAIPEEYTGHGFKPKQYDYQQGDCLKYSWRTPDYILGTVMRPPEPADWWVTGSAQSWFHGLIIQGEDTVERVVPVLAAEDDTFAEQYAVQSKGSFLCRKLPDGKNEELPMGVFVSKGLLRFLQHEGEFLFIPGPRCWVAVRAARGEFALEQGPFEDRWASYGRYYRLVDSMSPVIIETAPSGSPSAWPDFVKKVRAATLSVSRGEYEYASLSGDVFTLYDDRSRPEINGQTVNYSPAMAYDSPHVRAEWDSGVVTVSVGGETLTLDFMD